MTHHNISRAFGYQEGDRVGACLLPFWFGGQAVGGGHADDPGGFGGQLVEGYFGYPRVVAVFFLGFRSGGGPGYPNLFSFVAALLEFVYEQVAGLIGYDAVEPIISQRFVELFDRPE